LIPISSYVNGDFFGGSLFKTLIAEVENKKNP